MISISNGPDTGLAMTITAPKLATAGDGSTGCGFELTRNDQSGCHRNVQLRGHFDRGARHRHHRRQWQRSRAER